MIAIGPRVTAALLFGWALCACGGDERQQRSVEPHSSAKPAAPAQDSQRAHASAQPAKPPDQPLHKRTRRMMGTVISITAVAVPEQIAIPAMDAALDEMERLERLFSEWRPDSEISRINAAAGKRAVEVSDETIELLKASIDIARWSEGAFDVTWAALRGLYLFQPGQERVPSMAEIRKRLPLIDYRKVQIDERARTVKLLGKGMALGTGGIAKGYALDRAGDLLREKGIENFMIFGGGQIELSGTRYGRPWRVGIQHPRRADYFGFVEATSGSIATAGDYEHSFIADGKRWHHILDTRTGLPVEHTTSVTVIAESGLAADAIDTALFILGPERALRMLETAPFRADAVIVDKDLRLHLSPGMRDKLVMRTPLQDGKLPPGDPPH